jgi:hypothetical protein
VLEAIEQRFGAGAADDILLSAAQSAGSLVKNL